MKTISILCKAALALASTLFFAVASGQDRPAKRNNNFNPAAASSFSYVTTGVVVKIKSAGIARDGTITVRFTLTDSKGAGLDVNGVQTPGAESLAFVAAYIPNDQSQYTAYTTTVTKAASNNNPPQVQAGTDLGGTYTLIDAATGTYDYTFGTKAPLTFDATATHSIGVQSARNLSAYGDTRADTS